MIMIKPIIFCILFKIVKLRIKYIFVVCHEILKSENESDHKNKLDPLVNINFVYCNYYRIYSICLSEICKMALESSWQVPIMT